MKGNYAGAVIGIMLLAAGCSAVSSPAEATEVMVEEAVETSAAESQEESAPEKAENAKEEESLKAAEESLQAAEESLKAVEESLQAAGESLKAEEESIQADKDTDYEKMTKNPEMYQKKTVKFSGEIIRSAAVGNTSVQIVLAVDGEKKNRVVGEYKKSIVDGTLSTGDKITLSGEFQGLIRYRMNTGGAESLPTVNIGKIENIVRKEPETTAPQMAINAPSLEETVPVTDGVKPEETAPVSDGSKETEAVETREDVLDEETASETSPVISAGS